MQALFLNATLKRSPEPSSTGALSEYVAGRLAEHDVEVEHVRLADHVIEPGVVSEAVRDGDEWPVLHWTHSTGDAMAHVLAHTAKALAAQPIPKPQNS